MMTLERFEEAVGVWVVQCFGYQIASDRVERNHRFLEEALELVQACGCTRQEAHMLVEYVFDRGVGGREQELGGVLVTLAALASVQELDMQHCAILEFNRVSKPEMMAKLRLKQDSRPKNSPLPQ